MCYLQSDFAIVQYTYINNDDDDDNDDDNDDDDNDKDDDDDDDDNYDGTSFLFRYTSEEFYAMEMELLFKRQWVAVCSTHSLENKGDFITGG